MKYIHVITVMLSIVVSLWSAESQDISGVAPLIERGVYKERVITKAESERAKGAWERVQQKRAAIRSEIENAEGSSWNSMDSILVMVTGVCMMLFLKMLFLIRII